MNSTRPKTRILAHFPDLQAHKEGRDVLLVFNEDIGPAVKKACDIDADADAIHLARASIIIRREIFKMKAAFTFESQCQESSVSNPLVALLCMILYGPNIKTQSSYSLTPQAALTLSQLVMFNNRSVHCRGGTTNTLRHKKDRETPLPLYLVDPQQNA